jgi:hypothetical protein
MDNDSFGGIKQKKLISLPCPGQYQQVSIPYRQAKNRERVQKKALFYAKIFKKYIVNI